MTVQSVGGPDHEKNHRDLHCNLYVPLLRLAFGDETTWGGNRACVLFAGEGREAALLAPYVNELLVTDSSQECLDALHQRFEAEHRVRVVPGDGETLKGIATESIHTLTALVALMHLGRRPVRESYAHEIVRVLAPGGRALLQVMEGVGAVEQHFDSYGAPDVGFTSEEEVVAYWSAYLPIRWVLRTPPVPRGRAERCWWWVCLEKTGLWQ